MASIQGIYIALFGRPADPLGLDYFNAETSNGANLSAIGDLAGTAEYQDRFQGMSNAQIVTQIYVDLFGRNPDAAGLAYFVAELQSGAQSINTIAINILDGAQGADADLVDAKIAAADQFTAAIRSNPDALAAYQGSNGIAFGQAFLNQVVSGDFTFTDEQVAQFVADAAGAGPIGDTFTLTSGLDQLVGTANADTFQGTTANLGDFDSIDGGAGRDTLNLIGELSAVSTTGVSIKNIEIVNLSGNTSDVDAAFFGSATQQLWQINSAGDLSNVGANTTVGFRNANVSSEVSFAGATGSIALDNVANNSSIVLSGSSLTNVTVSGSIAQAAGAATVEVLTLHDHTSTATSSELIDTLTLSLTDRTEVNLSGEFDSLVTLNAAGSTAGLIIDLTSAVSLETATFGAGTDVVTVALGEANTAIDLGAGNDTVVINATGNTENVNLSVVLGAGSDIVDVNTLTNIVDASEAAFEAGIVSITDFNSATAGDVLDISGLGATFETLLANEVAAIRDAGSLFAAVELAASYLAAGNDAVAFNYGDDVYVFLDNGTAGPFDNGDGLLKLVGVSIGELNASNYVV